MPGWRATASYLLRRSLLTSRGIAAQTVCEKPGFPERGLPAPTGRARHGAGVLEPVFSKEALSAIWSNGKQARHHRRGRRCLGEHRGLLKDDAARIVSDRNVRHAMALNTLKVEEAQIYSVNAAQVGRQPRHQQIIGRGDGARHGLPGGYIVLPNLLATLGRVTDEFISNDDAQSASSRNRSQGLGQLNDLLQAISAAVTGEQVFFNQLLLWHREQCQPIVGEHGRIDRRVARRNGPLGLRRHDSPSMHPRSCLIARCRITRTFPSEILRNLANSAAVWSS